MKLYKNTLIISIIVFLFCVLLSFAFGLTYIAQYKITQIITDYLIGIACSVIVVIITTFLQFKYEQKRTLIHILSDMHLFFWGFLLVAYSLDPDEETPSKVWDYNYDKIYEVANKIISDLSNIEWFSKRKTKLAMKLQVSIMQVVLDITKFDSDKKDRLVNVFDTSSLEEIKDYTIQLIEDDKKEIERFNKDYQKIQDTLKELDTKNH